MTKPAERADYQWLCGGEAAEALDDLAGRNEPLHAAVSRLRKTLSAERAHLILEQQELRQRGAAKFSRAEALFFTRLGLEQATDQWVAAHKAERFRSHCPAGPFADLCCGIGGDLMALATIGAAIGVDQDPVSCCLAEANARAVGVAVRTTCRVQNVEQSDVADVAAWHIDPDRRPQGNRTTALEWSSPSTDVIEKLLAASPNAALKLAPAAEMPQAWQSRCELEWISRDRECRQLVAWCGSLAVAPGERRATVVASDGSASESFIGKSNAPAAFAPQLSRFLVEPDPAILAAHLGGAFAQQHSLSMVSAGIAYLTGPQPIKTPLAANFEIDEVMPLDLRKIGDELRRRRIGRLEIKKRGVEHNPTAVRKQLRLAGDQSATLFLTKLNGKHAAVLARRVMAPGASLSPAS
jgi:hypothetical protein